MNVSILSRIGGKTRAVEIGLVPKGSRFLQSSSSTSSSFVLGFCGVISEAPSA
jgi:hypothetical protein